MQEIELEGRNSKKGSAGESREELYDTRSRSLPLTPF